METKKRRNDEKKAPETWPDLFCCRPNAKPGRSPDCCASLFKAWDGRSMMDRCVRTCRGFLLIFATAGILLLLLGYALDAETTRILWIAVAGLVILLGVFGFLIIGLCRKTCS